MASTAVTFSTTAVAFSGTWNDPTTLMVSGVLATRRSPSLSVPLHWAAGPVRSEGLPARVSQMRTGARGEYGPGATMVSDSRAVADRPSASVTLKWMFGVPAEVGVPEMTPVEASRVRPGGSDPEVIDQV